MILRACELGNLRRRIGVQFSTLQSEVYELLRTNVSLLKKLADLALERVDSGQAVEAFSISSEEDQDVSSHILNLDLLNSRARRFLLRHDYLLENVLRA